MSFSLKDILLNFISAKHRRLPWDFNSSFYQYSYPDVALSGLKPRKHYRVYGKNAGRLYHQTKFIKREILNTNLETIIFCCDDAHANLFFLEAIKKISLSYNVIIVTNSHLDHQAYLDYCNWLIVDKNYDRENKYTKNLINKFGSCLAEWV